jgi:hypothetical protein
MPDAAARADMRIEIVKREINQGALAGLGSKISDYAAQLVINALDTYDEEALKAEFRRGFDAGEMNAALLGDRVVELEATLDRVRAVLDSSTYVDDFSRYVVTVDEVRSALRGEASHA